MSEHKCDECGIDRTDIISRYCESCHEWVESLDVDYEEWREDINADEEDAGEEDAGEESADNEEDDEPEIVEKDGHELAHGDKLVSDGNEIKIKIINGQVRLQDGPTRPVIANDDRIQHYIDLGYELVQERSDDSDSDDDDEKRLLSDGGQIESEPAENVERFDILLTPPGINKGGGYDRPTAMIILDIQDGATMLVDDRGRRRGPIEPGHIQGRVADGAMINVGPASGDLRRYFRAIDQEREDSSRRPDLASERIEQLMALIYEGLSPAEAIDYWMVEGHGLTQSGWADERGREQQAISKNVRKARKKLEATTEADR